MYQLDKKPFIYVLISAALFGVSSPLAKLLLKDFSPVALAGFLYIGAFLVLFAYQLVDKKDPAEGAQKLGAKDLPWLAGGMLTGSVIAPLSQLLGLSLTTGFSVSLLLNLEGLATAIIAILFFKESAGKRLWLALCCMTLAGVLLSWSPEQGHLSPGGPLLIILAVTCWGIDNNLMRQISDRNPVQIAYLKGLAGGVILVSLAFGLGAKASSGLPLLYAVLLGSISYGFSLVFFIKSLKGLGAVRTGAFFSLGPFIGATVSIFLLKENIGWIMFPALLLMASGAWLVINEKHAHVHTHPSVRHNHAHLPDAQHRHIHK